MPKKVVRSILCNRKFRGIPCCIKRHILFYCLRRDENTLFIRSYGKEKAHHTTETAMVRKKQFLVFDRKRDLRLKQVAIDDQLELSALKGCQVFRDGKSKSASLRGSGNVTTDESFGELIRADV